MSGLGLGDLFCGAGGMSNGFLLESIPPLVGFDIDPGLQYAYATNNRACTPW